MSIRIKEIEIENYKRFSGVHKIKFSQNQITAVFGVNGAGKTSILDAIAIVLQALTSSFANLNNFHGFNLRDISINHSQLTIKGSVETIISNEVLEGLVIVERDTNRKGESIRFPQELLLNLENNFKDVENSVIPVIVYYQTNRHFPEPNKQFFSYGRNSIYFDAFNSKIDYNKILTWYSQQVNIQNNEKIKRRDFDYTLPTLNVITEALNTFLKHLEGSEFVNTSVDVSKYNKHNPNLVLYVQKKDVKLEFHQLSAGEKMVIGMALDIAYRMSIANPNKSNPLETDGIVLIDELELHLHPKWQSSILSALAKTFPNVQFIISTHSPIVISNLKNEELLLVGKSKIIHGSELHNTYGRDVNSILEDFMGVQNRPTDVKKLMEDIEAVLDADEPNFDLAREKLDALKTIMNPNDHDILKLETLITLEEHEVD